MATATEIATKALKRLSVVGAGETAAAADVSDMTDALNAMIASWEAEGLSGDVLPLDARFEKAVIAMLAVDQAETYGKTPGPILMRDADRGWEQIRSAFSATPDAEFDPALLGTSYRWQTNGGRNYLPWIASQAYCLRDYVISNANIYECITAGMSDASGGPSGTSSSIQDGTAVWCWRRISA
jgi:hypothetical protein